MVPSRQKAINNLIFSISPLFFFFWLVLPPGGLVSSWNWGLLAFISYIFCELVRYQLLLYTSDNFLYNSSGGKTEHLGYFYFSPFHDSK